MRGAEGKREAARDYLLQGCTPNLPEEWAGEHTFTLALLTPI